MKIALIGRYGEGEIVAGPERVARELFFQLRKINPETVFIEYFFSGYAYSSLYKKLFGKEFIHYNSIVRLGIFPLILFLLKEKFEVIHIINLQRFIFILFFLIPFFNSKITATLHGFLRFEVPQKNFWSKRYFLDLWVEKLIISKCKLCVYPSQLLFETFSNIYNISNKKYHIIPNGICEIFKSQNRNFYPIDNSLRIVFYNGSIENINNGLERLVELLLNSKCKIDLYVIGERIKAKSLPNLEIIYSGEKTQKELIRFLEDKHFVIKSNTFDTFSIFIAECMTLGLIPIITDKIGMKDYINHKLNGFLYNASTLDDLANLLDEIFKRKYNLGVISANAKKISKELNWEIVAKTYHESFESLLK